MALRLFVAVYPPPDVVRGMHEALGGLDLPAHRLTRPEQVHLTLQFIGDTPAKELDDVCESVARAASGLTGFALTPARLVTLPARGPKRLVAATTDCPAVLRELHDRLVRRLASRPRPRPSDRYLPHLTLCRFRAPAAMPALDVPLDLEPFRVDEIKLMRSRLGAAGARHETVTVVPLDGPP